MILRVLVILIFAVLAARLWQIQIIHGREYRRASEENRIRVIPRQAPRGVMYDRRGRVLATSRLCFDVVVVPEEIEAQPQAVAELAAVLGETPADIADKLARRQAPVKGVTLAADVPLAVATRAAEAALHVKGMRLQTRPVRNYPLGAFAAHVLGYVRDISAIELKRVRGSGYTARDKIGKDGVERVLEASLRGSDGGEQVEVNAAGNLVRILGEVPAVAGDAIVLNLDAEVQRVAERGLCGKRGAAVVMGADNGGILALASTPSFDPNALCGKISRRQWGYLNGPDRPQQNRAAGALYEPGSVFKLITAVAAIEGGRATRASRFSCPGHYRLGEWRFRCWREEGHGRLDLISGMAGSCNVMFIKMGRSVGQAALERWARAFGLGCETGIDLADESSGLVPNPGWKRRRSGLPWYPGDTCQMAVGQGGLLITPLQAAVVTAAVANGGYLVTPHLVRAVGDSRIEAPAPRPVPVKASTLALVRQGMAAVVKRGTARRIWDASFPIAGKTGTAENPHGPPHAWFVGFAPVERPQVVVAVLVEQGGKGAGAAPMGAALLRSALRRDRADQDAMAKLP